ncbi:MAG: FHA domain-containing protein [Beijerinckiaceae bacterium]
MDTQLKNEVFLIYIAFFITLVLGAIPIVSEYAGWALVLQLFYVVMRRMSIHDSLFKSHATNYIIGVGVGLLMFGLINIQLRLIFNVAINGIASLFNGTMTASSVFYVPLIGVEAIFGFFTPIFMIARGLYLIAGNRPAFSWSREIKPENNSARTTKLDNYSPMNSVRSWLVSAVLPNGKVLQFKIPADGSSRIIGRSNDSADLVVDDTSVSRRHARIEARDGFLWLSDLGSLNKTYVGGNEVGPHSVRLKLSDQIRLGEVKLTVSAV